MQIMFGDITKGGRKPTREEEYELANRYRRGILWGLRRCKKCNYFRGKCIDDARFTRGLLMEVSCKCDNDAYCKFCGELLSKFKPNSNYFNEKDKKIWHVPWFTVLGHKCN
jgi:hypothetical protein